MILYGVFIMCDKLRFVFGKVRASMVKWSNRIYGVSMVEADEGFSVVCCFRYVMSYLWAQYIIDHGKAGKG